RRHRGASLRRGLAGPAGALPVAGAAFAVRRGLDPGRGGAGGVRRDPRGGPAPAARAPHGRGGWLMRVLGDWLLTPQRVAVHLPSATGVVADLHLGYGQARRASGEAVPAPPLAAQLAPLRRALALHGARRLVVAGDLLEEARREGGVLNEL